jgi:hypothetical protein
MIINFMADKLIITFDEYTKIVEKLAIEIHKNYKPTVLSWNYERCCTNNRYSYLEF